jgi:hypothetical protein
VNLFIGDRPSPAWVARELDAGRSFETRCDCAHNPRDYRDALACEHRERLVRPT